MLIIILIAIFLLIIFLELPRLLKENLYKEVVVFSVVLTVGIFMSLANFYNWPIYNPIEALALFLSKYYYGG